jgi:hypothetical protein
VYSPAVHEALLSCLRNDKPFQDALLPWLAKSHTGRKLCFEELFDMDNLKNFPLHTLSIYRKYNPTPDGNVIASFIVFIKGFLFWMKIAANMNGRMFKT